MLLIEWRYVSVPFIVIEVTFKIYTINDKFDKSYSYCLIRMEVQTRYIYLYLYIIFYKVISTYI